MTKNYLLSLTAAAALGAGTAQLVDFNAHASEPQTKPAIGSAVYTVAQASSATGLQMAKAACASIDAQLGLTGSDKCALADLKNFCIFFNDEANPGKAVLTAQAQLSGTWTRGAAE